MQYEWDPNKNEQNIKKHGFCFQDAWMVLEGKNIECRSYRNSEERWKAIGVLKDKYVAVVYAKRENKVRIISIRRARLNERREYCELYN